MGYCGAADLHPKRQSNMLPPIGRPSIRNKIEKDMSKAIIATLQDQVKSLQDQVKSLQQRIIELEGNTTLEEIA